MSRQTPQKSSTVEIRIDADLAEKLRSVCGAQGVTVSSVIRGLITEYCEAAPVVASVTKSGNRDGAVQDLKGLIKRGSGLLRVGEMYCGPGGIGLGAVEAAVTTERGEYRFSHSFATDYDPDTCQTYARNLRRHSPQVSVICQDIRELDIASLPVTDGLMFGFPCNDFSTVGETKGINGTFGPLYRYGVEYIARVNPLFFFAENVSGLQSANSGEAFELILNDLANAGKHGYVLTTHLYRFEEYGIPQARHRIVIIGIRKDLKRAFQVPRPHKRIRTCRDAIERPPIPKNAPNHERTVQSQRVVARLSHIKPGENAWTANLPPHLRLNVGGAQLSQIYKRLDPAKPAYTVTGSGGGGTHVYHWKENRALTNRERARLQTFPDDFEFVGSKESVRRQIGMAVPPAAAKVILEAVLKTLIGVDYPSVPSSFQR